jgi:hypothetical protein
VTAVWPWSDITITAYAGEKLSRPRRPHETADRVVAALEHGGRGVRPGRVGGVVVVREVEEEKVEAVAVDEPRARRRPRRSRSAGARFRNESGAPVRSLWKRL